MVNASLNWASIVGIVLAVCGAGLYFMRSFKPALARDYDVFFAAIGLLCGGILFFQGWRLDPILQFGQFLLAGTTVFFAYESVRLRGIATDQARRSAYFEEDDREPLRSPRGGLQSSWEDSYDRFDESPQPIRRRISNRDDINSQDEEFSPRRISRAAIPEEAISRRSTNRSSKDPYANSDGQDNRRRMERFGSSSGNFDQQTTFGERRTNRQQLRRGSRPLPNENSSSGKDNQSRNFDSYQENKDKSPRNSLRQNKSSGFEKSIEDAAFSSSNRSRRNSADTSRDRQPNSRQSGRRSSYSNETGVQRSSRSREGTDNPSSRYKQPSSNKRGPSRPRDNSSRFDD